MPSVARCETMRWISAFAPTSMPRVGWSRISTRGAGISHLASSTFCWLPPDSVLVSCSIPVATTRIRPAKSSASFASARAIDHAEPVGEAAQHRQRLVRPDRELEHEPLVVAVLGQERDAELQGILRRARSDRAAVDADLAAVGPGDAEQHLGDLGAAGADQAEEAQDLARAQIEAHVLDEPGAGQPAHAQRPARRSPPPPWGRRRRARCRSCAGRSAPASAPRPGR